MTFNVCGSNRSYRILLPELAAMAIEVNGQTVTIPLLRTDPEARKRFSDFLEMERRKRIKRTVWERFMGEEAA